MNKEFVDECGKVSDEVFDAVTEPTKGKMISVSTPKRPNWTKMKPSEKDIEFTNDVNAIRNEYLNKSYSRPDVRDIIETIGKFRHNDPLAKEIYKASIKKDNFERIVLLESLVEHLFNHRAVQLREKQMSHFG